MSILRRIADSLDVRRSLLNNFACGKFLVRIFHLAEAEPMAVIDAFEREPPPGFRGLQPHAPIRFYARHLPHWRQDGATYFVTFRLSDALPPAELEMLRSIRRRWELTHPDPRSKEDWEAYAFVVTQKAEVWLDRGYGACHFAGGENATLLAHALRHYETQCFVTCLVIMPNHAHAIMKPLPGFELEETLQRIKGYVARHVNRRRNQTGSIWEQESYDRIIRDLSHLERVIQYVGSNGSRARLKADCFQRWIHPEWQAAGWGFCDEAVE